MSLLDLIEQEIIEESSTRFKNLKFEYNKGIYILTLHDNSGYSIVKGYGKTIIEAINDMHSCLI